MTNEINVSSELKVELEKLQTLKESNPTEYVQKLQELNTLLKDFNQKAKDLIKEAN